MRQPEGTAEDLFLERIGSGLNFNWIHAHGYTEERTALLHMRKLILISDSGCDALRLISLSMIIYETLIFFWRNAESIKDNNLIFPAF